LFLLGLLALFWGANWPIMKVALGEVPPWVFRALASTSGGAGLLLIAWLGRLPLRVPRREWGRLAIASLLNITVWNILILYGVAMMNSGRAAILAYTMPLWASLFAIFFLGEALTRRRVAALLLGLVGMALLFAGGATREEGLLGPALVVVSAVCWGAGTVAVKRFGFSMPVTVFTAWQHLVGVAPIVVVALAWDVHHIGEVTLFPALGVLYNMTVTAVFCYWAYFKIVASLPVAVSTIGTMVVPVIGVFCTALVFATPPAPADYAALTAVICAVYLALVPGRGGA
jgi:drug/metabolite transporter (DMT)-like permease